MGVVLGWAVEVTNGHERRTNLNSTWEKLRIQNGRSKEKNISA